MVSPGWVGTTNWFAMLSIQNWLGVGQVVPHMISAVLGGGGGTSAADAGATDAITPTPSATASAPIRPMCFAIPVMRWNFGRVRRVGVQ